MRLSDRYAFLFKNTLLFAIANFSNKLIVFFLLPFYTAYLTKEEYAVIDMISLAQQMIFPIVTLDITEAVIRFCMEKETDKASVFSVSVLVSLAGYLVLGIGCATAVACSIGNSAYILYFLLFSLVLGANTLLSSFYRTIDKVNVITVSSIASTLVTTVSNVVLIAWKGMGVEGYYISYVIGNLTAIAIMLLWVDLRPYLRSMTRRQIRAQLLPLVKYSLPLIPNALFWWINGSLDRICLIAISGLAFEGLYAAANKIPAILSTLTSIFQQSWGLSRFRETESQSKQEFFDQVYGAYNLCLLCVTAALILLSKFLGSFLLSKDFFDAWPWVPWLVLAFYSNSLCSFIGTEFTAAKKTTWILSTTMVSAAVNIVLNLLLIPHFTGLGAAIATCTSYVVLLEMRVWSLKRFFGLRINNTQLVALHLLLVLLVLCVTHYMGVASILVGAVSLGLMAFIERKEAAFLLGKAKEFLHLK